MSGGFWSLLTVVGPLLLGAVILFALLRNRKQSSAEVDRTERATHQNYVEQDAQDKRNDGGSDAT